MATFNNKISLLLKALNASNVPVVMDTRSFISPTARSGITKLFIIKDLRYRGKKAELFHTAKLVDVVKFLSEYYKNVKNGGDLNVGVQSTE